jgi:hypothetical protein
MKAIWTSTALAGSCNFCDETSVSVDEPILQFEGTGSPHKNSTLSARACRSCVDRLVNVGLAREAFSAEASNEQARNQDN